jgi:hypothetical protein
MIRAVLLGIADRRDDSGCRDGSGTGDRLQPGHAIILCSRAVQLAPIPEYSAVQGHELVAEVGRHVSCEVRQILLGSFKTPFGKSDGVADALWDNDAKLG